jgi:hypothetical protein
MVFAEHLTQETPDGGDRVEHAVSILDAMFVEHIPDASLGQNICERESLIARKAGAYRIQASHGIASRLTAIPTAQFHGDSDGSRS